MADTWTAASRSVSSNQVRTSPSETGSCQLTFATDDDLDMDDRSVVEEADRQGRIVVKLRRGHFSKQKVEEGHGAKSFDPPEHIDTKTAHNKVVHKHHVSHALKYRPQQLLLENTVS